MSKEKKEPADLRIEYMPLGELVKWPRNPKEHDIDMIGKSVSRFGFVQPILMDEHSGQIVAGHGRIETLEEKKEGGENPPLRVRLDDTGEWLVPVVRGVEFNSDGEMEAYAVADNHAVELGGWDQKTLADVLSGLADEDGLDGTGWDADEVEKILVGLNNEEQEDSTYTPEIGHQEYTDRDFEQAGEHLNDNIRKEREQQTVMCPECGTEFFVDSKDI